MVCYRSPWGFSSDGRKFSDVKLGEGGLTLEPFHWHDLPIIICHGEAVTVAAYVRGGEIISGSRNFLKK